MRPTERDLMVARAVRKWCEELVGPLVTGERGFVTTFLTEDAITALRALAEVKA